MYMVYIGFYIISKPSTKNVYKSKINIKCINKNKTQTET